MSDEYVCCCCFANHYKRYGQQTTLPAFKILLLGHSGVGKSSLLIRYIDNTFSEHYSSSLGVDFKMKNATVEGKKVKLQIWDFAGSERFVKIAKTCFTEADAVCYVYDITNQESFDDISGYWTKQVEDNGTKPTAIRFLVGNKCDLNDKRKVAADKAKQVQLDNKWAKHFETSAKLGTSVNEMFDMLATAVLQEFEKSGGDKKGDWRDVRDQNKKKCILM